MKSHLWLGDMKAIAIRMLSIECINIDNSRTNRLLDGSKNTGAIKPEELFNELKIYKKSKWREDRRERLKQFSEGHLDVKILHQGPYKCDPCEKVYSYPQGLTR